jgi:hypothetical protein
VNEQCAGLRFRDTISSNQSMQPTTGRRTFKFPMIQTAHPAVNARSR